MTLMMMMTMTVVQYVRFDSRFFVFCVGIVVDEFKVSSLIIIGTGGVRCCGVVKA